MAWIFFQSANKTNIVSIESAAESMKQMKQDFLFYKRAYEDSSQNALWSYMLEYFVQRYEKIPDILNLFSTAPRGSRTIQYRAKTLEKFWTQR